MQIGDSRDGFQSYTSCKTIRFDECWKKDSAASRSAPSEKEVLYLLLHERREEAEITAATTVDISLRRARTEGFPQYNGHPTIINPIDVSVTAYIWANAAFFACLRASTESLTSVE